MIKQPVEPCICGHGKRDHEGQTGACSKCDCMTYMTPAAEPDDDDED
jgi:hypothetical protein